MPPAAGLAIRPRPGPGRRRSSALPEGFLAKTQCHCLCGRENGAVPPDASSARTKHRKPAGVRQISIIVRIAVRKTGL